MCSYTCKSRYIMHALGYCSIHCTCTSITADIKVKVMVVDYCISVTLITSFQWCFQTCTITCHTFTHLHTTTCIPTHLHTYTLLHLHTCTPTHLHSLTQLDASHNQLVSVPSHIFHLPELTELNLSYNLLQRLPGDPELVTTGMRGGVAAMPSCSHVLMFPCPHVPMTHVPMSSCSHDPCSHASMFP